MDSVLKFFGFSDQGPGQQKAQAQKKNQIVDQNYANQILFMALSVLETIEYKQMQKLKQNAQTYNLKKQEKEFGLYDKNDYFSKSDTQLKYQLRNNVMIFAESKKAFEIIYGQNSYKLPKNYNMNKILERLSLFKKTFSKSSDKAYFHLTEDIEKILKNEKSNYFYQTVEVINPEQQNKNNFMKEAIWAANEMRKEQLKTIQKYGQEKDASNLQFKENKIFKSK